MVETSFRTFACAHFYTPFTLLKNEEFCLNCIHWWGMLHIQSLGPCWECHLYSLGLALLGDVLDGQTLFANDGSHKLCGDEQSQWEVMVCVVSSLQAPHGPGVGGVRLPRPSASSGRPTLGLGSRFTVVPTTLHVQNVGHTEGVIIQTVTRQLLYGPDKRFTFKRLGFIHTQSVGSLCFKKHGLSHTDCIWAFSLINTE